MDPKHIVILSGREYPLFAGILSEAHSIGLAGIETQLIQIPTEENGQTAIVKAVVRMKDGGTFEGYGDANPRNVNPRIATALLRMAETRAKGRALRDAINCGQTMLEELPGDEEHAPGQARAREAVAKAEKPLVTKPKGEEQAAACVECGVVMSPGQVKVSQAKFRLNLCPDHQRAAAKATNGKAEVAA